ncbi:MAG: hypothetical protein O6931_05125 [Gammaproteobacteria bacterium]|nr:hypothetical protein [Gammaproteobacteria bacterium]
MAKDDRFGKFTIRGDSRNQDIGEEQLIKLYRNRAELKIEFKRLRNERHKLEEELAKKDGELKKSRSELASFEKLLAEPTTAFNTLVFFQLRGIWDECGGRVKKLVADMTQVRETRERQLHVAEFSKAQGVRAAKFKTKEEELLIEQEEFDQIIAKLQSNSDELKGFWNYFKRREFQSEIRKVKAQRLEPKEKMAQLAKKRHEIEAEQPPEFGDLSTQGKRAINLVALAATHYLYEHYAASGIYKLVRATTLSKPQKVSYGDKAACEKIMLKINELRMSLNSQANFNERLRKRTERIKSVAGYRKNEDCIPLAKTLAKIPAGTDKAKGNLLETINLIGDQVWNVHNVLLT